MLMPKVVLTAVLPETNKHNSLLKTTTTTVLPRQDGKPVLVAPEHRWLTSTYEDGRQAKKKKSSLLMVIATISIKTMDVV